MDDRGVRRHVHHEASPEPDKPTLVVIGDFLEDSWKALIAFAAGVTVIVGAIVAVRGLRRKPTVAPGDQATGARTDRPLMPQRRGRPHSWEPASDLLVGDTGFEPVTSSV